MDFRKNNLFYKKYYFFILYFGDLILNSSAVLGKILIRLYHRHDSSSIHSSMKKERKMIVCGYF